MFINVSVEGCVRDPNRFFVFFSSGFPPHMGSRERFFPGASNGDLILSTCSNLVRATLAFSEIFFGHWCYFYWSSRMFVSDFIFLRNYTHLHCSILISFTSSLFPWLSLLALSLLHRGCRPTPNVGLTTVMCLPL